MRIRSTRWWIPSVLALVFCMWPVPAGAEDTSAPLHTEPIPGWVADQVDIRYNFDTFFLNSDLLPNGLTADELSVIVNRVAPRWGLSVLGATSEAPGVRDGTNSVGFSDTLDDDTLGVTTTFMVNHYARHRKRCRRVHRKGRRVRRCRRGRMYLRWREVVEEDTEFNRFENWNFGPLYPADDQYDFESVVIHELGHFAGNRHGGDCDDSPMWAALDTGEWWHGVDDWRKWGCVGSLRLGDSASAHRHGRLVHRTVIVRP